MQIETMLAEIEARAKVLMEGCVEETCTVCAGERERLRLVAALRVAVGEIEASFDDMNGSEVMTRIGAALKGDGE